MLYRWNNLEHAYTLQLRGDLTGQLCDRKDITNAKTKWRDDHVWILRRMPKFEYTESYVPSDEYPEHPDIQSSGIQPCTSQPSLDLAAARGAATADE